MLLDHHRTEPLSLANQTSSSGLLAPSIAIIAIQRAASEGPTDRQHAVWTTGGPTPDLLTVWVPDFSDELHLWRSQRIVIGEGEVRFEKPAFTESPDQKLKTSEFQKNICNICKVTELPAAVFYLQKGVLWTDDHHLPFVDVIVVDETG